MDQEMQYMKKRFIDLSKRAESKSIVTFTNFLNLNELNIFSQITKELYCSYQVSGGYEHAERQMVAFIPDALYYAWAYPFDAVCLRSLHSKFAENLTHRDILGALMHLGIKREMLGDLLIQDSQSIVFCVNSVTSYIIDHCNKIRHTTVSCQQIPLEDFSYEPKIIEKNGIVSSLRLDTILADVCKLPRSAAQKLIIEGNAFVNSQKTVQNAYNCQNGDILSVRHFGKFQIETDGGLTKKGRIKCRYKIYS